MTYRELTCRLSAAGIENAAWEAAELLAHFCKLSPAAAHLSPDRDFVSAALESAVRQREARYPLQYLLGEWDFYRQTYEVSPDCLIPRSDTECLVEEAIRRLPQGACFADLCTGSGCIAISTLCERPDTRCLAVDKFPRTLELACRNAAKNRVSERFTPLCADVLESHFLPSEARFDAVLSNPPYIRTDALEGLGPELFSEPRAALDGGEDGLLFYRSILQNTKGHLRPGGFFLFEIGFDQADDLCRIGHDFGFSEIEVLRDLGGNDRVVYLK